MGYLQRFFVFSLTIQTLCKPSEAEESCGHFDFTKADGSVYTAAENITGVIPFQVTNITCDGSIPFVVGFKSPNDKKVDDDCIIFLSSTDKHPCLNISRTGQYQYELRKTFHRSDNGVMIVLSAVDGKIQTRNITLDIHYPARVTSLNITQSSDLTYQPVEPNSTITVACSWETGNPGTTALLLDRNRTKMASDPGGSGQLQYTVDSVSSDDAGRIYCEAPGASENRTVTLLVKCPPKFADTERSLNPSDTESTISLDFRAHTGDIEECRMKKVESSSTSGLHVDCLSLINVTGSPPDLVLTVRLDNVRKQDEGQWTLTLTNDAGKGHVQFARKLTEDQARIISVQLENMESQTNGILEPGSNETVVCSWRNTLPPVTARLLDRHGATLTTSKDSSGQIRYRFPAVGCQDAGPIRCEAPGASHNETSNLLVKCPPQFVNSGTTEIKVKSGQDMKGEFPVRTHTTDFTSCLLTKTDKGFVLTANCTSSASLDGTPPDLLLTVQLDNIKTEYEGQWRLSLTNDAGTGYLDFTVVFNDDLPVTIGACVAAFLLVMITAAIVCVRKRRKRSTRPQPAVQLAVIERRSMLTEEDGSAPSAHIYFEIVDPPPPSDEEDASDEATSPPTSHGDGNPPAYYVGQSVAETAEEGSGWNNAPFYENTPSRNTEVTAAVAVHEADPANTAGVSDTRELVHPSSRLQTGASGDEHANDSDDEIEETGYVRYSPRLYENTKP